MAAELIQRCRTWLDRLWAGEVPLISDANWLPNPTDGGDPRVAYPRR